MAVSAVYMVAPAVSSGKGAPPLGAGLVGGLFSRQEWEEFRTRSRRIFWRAKNRERCLEQSRRRARDLFCNQASEIPSAPYGEGLIGPDAP